MFDEAQNYLTSEIETLRSAVFRADALNARALSPSAEAHLENVLHLIVVSSEVEEATFLTVTRIDLFARALDAPTESGAVEQARRDALLAIDALATVLERSTPSQATAMDSRLDAAIAVLTR
ncbi:MAG: hypothetical protein DCF30_22385 [Hyphomicrobiales bacterium]|nr:MAG: hypothetical protein DCF30_22385 [Hyphomicrobiales bacterium]